MQLLDFIETIPYPKTDKYDLGYIHEFYDRLLSPRQQSVKNLLEIGMQNGYSMRLWRDFFPNAEIYGMDVIKCHSLTGEPRIHTIYENAYTEQAVAKFDKEFFDVIIDDGPHTFETMNFFCKHYLQLLKSGGVLILEDIVNTAWTEKFLTTIGDYKTTVVNMGSLVRTEPLRKRWQRGLDVIIVEKSHATFL